jgi:tripartite-type tricarboxylate transporter receptor subunit TctC
LTAAPAAAVVRFPARILTEAPVIRPSAILLAFLCVAPGIAHAQTWPARAVSIVVPFAAGGGTDAIARFIADRLKARLGQSVVVDNRAGAASAIGTAYVAKAPADGYTILMTTNSAQVILPLTQPAASLNYNVQDFVPIGLVATFPNILIVSPKLPVNSVAEFIAHAKANPGKLSFASSGTGTITHLIGELFNAQAGIEAVHVPYRTGALAAPDVMEGRVHYQFDNILWSLPLIRDGKLKGLGITTRRRSTLAPDMPTVAESGLPGFEGISWIGLVVPARTPPDIVQRLDRELTAILADPEMVGRIAKTGAEPPTTLGPAGFRALLAQDTARWQDIFRQGKIKLK